MNHQPNLTHSAARSQAERAAARAAMHSWAACHGPCRNTQGPAKTTAPQPAATAQQKMEQESLPPQRSPDAHTHGPPRAHRANIRLGDDRAHYILAAQGLCCDSPHKDSPRAWHPGTPALARQSDKCTIISTLLARLAAQALRVAPGLHLGLELRHLVRDLRAGGTGCCGEPVHAIRTHQPGHSWHAIRRQSIQHPAGLVHRCR